MTEDRKSVLAELLRIGTGIAGIDPGLHWVRCLRRRYPRSLARSATHRDRTRERRSRVRRRRHEKPAEIASRRARGHVGSCSLACDPSIWSIWKPPVGQRKASHSRLPSPGNTPSSKYPRGGTSFSTAGLKTVSPTEQASGKDSPGRHPGAEERQAIEFMARTRSTYKKFVDTHPVRDGFHLSNIEWEKSVFAGNEAASAGRVSHVSSIWSSKDRRLAASYTYDGVRIGARPPNTNKGDLTTTRLANRLLHQIQVRPSREISLLLPDKDLVSTGLDPVRMLNPADITLPAFLTDGLARLTIATIRANANVILFYDGISQALAEFLIQSTGRNRSNLFDMSNQVLVEAVRRRLRSGPDGASVVIAKYNFRNDKDITESIVRARNVCGNSVIQAVSLMTPLDAPYPRPGHYPAFLLDENVGVEVWRPFSHCENDAESYNIIPVDQLSSGVVRISHESFLSKVRQKIGLERIPEDEPSE